MKYILIFIILFICISGCKEDSTVNAQTNSNEGEITNFFNAVDEFDSYYNDSLGWQKEFTENEIMDISKKWYIAVSQNPVEYYFYFLKLHKEWKEKVKSDREKYLYKRPGLQLGRLKSKIEEYESPVFTELLNVPYFLRVKILSFEHSNYYSEDINGSFPQTDMLVKIEDVLKGGDIFIPNDTIRISYLNWWFQDAKEENRFKINTSYFILTRVWRIESADSFYYSIYSLPDDNHGVYQIINDSISTPNDYWGIGEKTKWYVFKNNILQNYILK